MRISDGSSDVFSSDRMDKEKIKRVVGLSSTVSLIKDNPDAAVNRRISLVVLNRRAERRIDAQNATAASLVEFQEASQSGPLPGQSVAGPALDTPAPLRGVGLPPVMPRGPGADNRLLHGISLLAGDDHSKFFDTLKSDKRRGGQKSL